MAFTCLSLRVHVSPRNCTFMCELMSDPDLLCETGGGSLCQALLLLSSGQVFTARSICSVRQSLIL